VVDEVLGECQTVIRNLGRLYRHVQVVSGATILGNGMVALILDPQRLVQEAVRAKMQRERGRAMSSARERENGHARDSTARSGPIDGAPERWPARAFNEVQHRERAGTMPSTEITERQKGNGHLKANGHVVAGRANGAKEHATDEALLVSQEILRLVEASKEGRLSERGRPEQFTGMYREMVEGINEMLDAILLPIGEGNRILAQISSGKIDELIAATYKGDHEKMKVAVNNVGLVLQSLQKELDRLTDASKEGQLQERGKPEQFQGAYAEIVRGVNAMLDAILLPIGEGNRILAQISSGKIDELIAQTYKGDHEKMKVAVNNVAVVTQALQKEMARLIEASREGQLSDRGKPELFQGAYAEIVRGVNTMLDAILLPIERGIGFWHRSRREGSTS